MTSWRTTLSGLAGATGAALNDQVVALYVDPKGPYPGLVTHWFDEARDAQLYTGRLPIVAHPPCGPWGRLRHLSKYEDPELALAAVEVVQRVGGVLEHPAGSKLWERCGLPAPWTFSADGRAFTIEVCQVDWGHVARKRTWLYCVDIYDLPPFPAPREPTHACTGGRHYPGRKYRGYTGNLKCCSATQRRRTPKAFAEFLIGLASQVADSRGQALGAGVGLRDAGDLWTRGRFGGV